MGGNEAECLARLRGVRAIENANLALRFGLELAALASLAAWGLHAGGTGWERAALATAAPACAAGVWGLFVSPRARYRGLRATSLLAEAAVWGAATLALVGMAQPLLATGFAAIAVASRSVKSVFDARARTS
jgi:hypothetical protein